MNACVLFLLYFSVVNRVTALFYIHLCGIMVLMSYIWPFNNFPCVLGKMIGSKPLPTRNIDQDEGELDSEDDMRSSSSEGYTSDGGSDSNSVCLYFNDLFQLIFPKMFNIFFISG